MDIEVFTDEFVIKNKYMGIGTLFVPLKEKYNLANTLSNFRCLNEKNTVWNWDMNLCKNKYCEERYHNQNNCEIHFSNIVNKTSHSKLQISKNWLQHIIDRNLNDYNKILFNILILELEKLDKSFFGNEENIESSIYAKFYKSNLIYGCKRFFIKNNIKEVSIKNMYHDQSLAKETHEYLDTNVPKLNYEKKITSNCDKVTFIDSNHENNDKYLIESQFIQFIDLILGSTRQILFENSKTKNKIEVSNILYPLVKRLIESPNNKNSSYNYFDSQHISFFPKNKLTKHKDLLSGQLILDKGQFHYNFKVPKKNEIAKNNLDQWF